MCLCVCVWLEGQSLPWRCSLRQEECLNSSTSKFVCLLLRLSFFVSVCVCFILSVFEMWVIPSQMVFLCHLVSTHNAAVDPSGSCAPWSSCAVHSPASNSLRPAFVLSLSREKSVGDLKSRLSPAPYASCCWWRMLLSFLRLKRLIMSNCCRFWGIWAAYGRDYLCFCWWSRPL